MTPNQLLVSRALQNFRIAFKECREAGITFLTEEPGDDFGRIIDNFRYDEAQEKPVIVFEEGDSILEIDLIEQL